MKKTYTLVLICLIGITVKAQVGIGTTTPSSSTALEIDSPSAGVLIPRVALTSTIDATTITNGNVESLLVYNTATVLDVTPGFYYWSGTKWERMITQGSESNDWKTSGNTDTTNGTNFIGTIDAQDLDFRTNNTINLRLTQKNQLEFVNNSRSEYIGERAGFSNTNATNRYNTFIGYESGYKTTTGKDNVFIGGQSGRENVSGSDNVFIGSGAGTFTTSSSNTFVGQGAGLFNTTGNVNCFYGNATGQKTTTGSSNAFYGTFAGFSNTTGSHNLFMGLYTGSGNEQGNSNSYFGSESGEGTYNGSENTFMGRRAGYININGNNNTYIGFEAGRENRNGNNNLFLGNKAGNTLVGVSNRLIIDNSNTTTPLIEGFFDTDKLNVNGTLHINDVLSLQPKASAPTSPTEGQIYYDAATKKVRVWTGAAWENLN